MGAMNPIVKPSLPEDIAYLYDQYRELKFSRVKDSNHDYGDNEPIRYKLMVRDVLKWSEIESYSNLTGFRFKPWEVRVLMKIDGVFQHSRGE